MYKICVVLVALFAFSSAAVLREFTPQNEWSVLKCKNGNLTGLEDFVNLFKEVVDECQSAGNSKDFYSCIGVALAMTEDDGTPSVTKINDLFTTLFSEMILEDIPSFKEELLICAEDYVSNYNEVEGASESTETFFQCFTQVTQAFSEDIEKVCNYEHVFNAKYLAAHEDE